MSDNDDYEEDDFLEGLEREQLEKDMQVYRYDQSAKTAWSGIQEQGFDHWFHQYVYQTTYKSLVESKVNVIENLIKYYVEKEMYERCTWLQSNLDRCIEDKRALMLDGQYDDDFYNWCAKHDAKPTGATS
jgi:hypothetical protein